MTIDICCSAHSFYVSSANTSRLVKFALHMSFFITLERDDSISVVTGLIDFERLILVTISCHMLR